MRTCWRRWRQAPSCLLRAFLASPFPIIRTATCVSYGVDKDRAVQDFKHDEVWESGDERATKWIVLRSCFELGELMRVALQQFECFSHGLQELAAEVRPLILIPCCCFANFCLR